MSVTVDAERLAREMYFGIRAPYGWSDTWESLHLHGASRRAWLAAAQSLIDAGWTPPKEDTVTLTDHEKVAMLAEAMGMGPTARCCVRLLADPRIGAAISAALDGLEPEPDPVEEWADRAYYGACMDAAPEHDDWLAFVRAEVEAGRLTIGAPE